MEFVWSSTYCFVFFPINCAALIWSYKNFVCTNRRLCNFLLPGVLQTVNRGKICVKNQVYSNGKGWCNVRSDALWDSGNEIIFCDGQVPFSFSLVSTSWHTVEDTYRAPPIDRSILPTAPRAAREPNIDRSRLPRGPPYTAFLGNLPYDVSEESITEFFRGLAVSGDLQVYIWSLSYQKILLLAAWQVMCNWMCFVCILRSVQYVCHGSLVTQRGLRVLVMQNLMMLNPFASSHSKWGGESSVKYWPQSIAFVFYFEVTLL